MMKDLRGKQNLEVAGKTTTAMFDFLRTDLRRLRQ